MIPKRKATQFAIVNLIHCRRVRRRDLLAKGRLPTFMITNLTTPVENT
ncbi:MAG: hypothetical protein LBK82_14560 [Planctomycetaceae bacterium]|nr:hypothetical protein [Planctomycetaceae bacterium]